MTTVLITLRCEHVLEFALADWAPSLGELVWCVRCEKYQRVAVAPHRYRAKCRTCSWGTSTRPSKMRADADRAAERHHKRRGHRVYVLDGNVVVGTLGERPRRDPAHYRTVLERLYERDPALAEKFLRNLEPKP